MWALFRVGILTIIVSAVFLCLRRGDAAFKLQDLTPNTTVVILNWSRPFNVYRIASEICKDIRDTVIHSIIIWNNNPKILTSGDFGITNCSESEIRIINSQENLYFQARYIACTLATTGYCFIQDDDYLIPPEIIRALTSHMNANHDAPLSIHLQPPQELLRSTLRTIIAAPTIKTTFAWLGYGTIIRKSQAVEFLTLLNLLNISDEQRKMADNYFTILKNDLPELWFDASIELFGGTPFTSGAEGEERNNRHIVKAAEILDHLVKNTESHILDTYLPYTQFHPRYTGHEVISRAPCHGKICIFSTSINLLPGFDICERTNASAYDILVLEQQRLDAFGKDQIQHYVNFPPSNAIDGDTDTIFHSPHPGRKDEWLLLDLTAPKFHAMLQFILEVDSATLHILRHAVYEISTDSLHWTALDKHQPSCMRVAKIHLSLTEIEDRIQCIYSVEHVTAQYLRLRLLNDAESRWGIAELYALSA